MRYNAIITDHFDHPRNAGPMQDADVVGEATNAVCLDRLRIYLRLDSGRQKVEAASFEAEGCVPSLAAGSLLTELVVGRGVSELKQMDTDALEAALGGLPATKKHAAHLAAEALASALERSGW